MNKPKTFLWSSLVFLLMWMTSCWRNILEAWVSSRQGPQRAWPATFKWIQMDSTWPPTFRWIQMDSDGFNLASNIQMDSDGFNLPSTVRWIKLGLQQSPFPDGFVGNLFSLHEDRQKKKLLKVCDSASPLNLNPSIVLQIFWLFVCFFSH